MNEEGTVAAAVTTISAVPASIEPPKAYDMKVNKPYLFAIVHLKTSALLFLGSVEAPEGGAMPVLSNR